MENATNPLKVPPTPVKFLTVMSGVPSRLNAVVAKETELPAATDPNDNSPVTLKLPGALLTEAALNALYATASITSPFVAPPPKTANVDPSEEV